MMAETRADPALAPAPKGVLLKADTIAEPFLAEVKANLAAVLSPSSSSSSSTTGRPHGPPKLVGILATASAAPSRSYAEFTRRQCAALGIAFELREVGEDDGVEDAIIEANADNSVGGIMVRLARSSHAVHLISKTKNNLPGILPDFREGAGTRLASRALLYIYPIHATGPLLAADRLALQGRRRAQLQVPLQPLPQVTPALLALTPTLRSDLHSASATSSRSPSSRPRPLSQRQHR